MRKFESLNPTELPEHFEVEDHGEQPFVIVNEDRGRIDVSYIFPGFYISDHVRNIGGQNITFKQINIGGTGWIAESGRPLLPSFGRYVQIPHGCDFSISVNQGNPVVFDNVLVYPAQTMLKDRVNEEVEFEYDKDFYDKTAVYPKKIVGTRGSLEVNGYSSLLLNVCPLQYFPSQDRLEGYGNITVTIALEAKNEAATISPIDPATNNMAFGNLFVNPEPGVEERVFPGVKYFLPPVKPRGSEFIIIYHDDFKKAAESLARWKNTRGLRTETVSINDNEIGNTVDNIKTYIRSRRKQYLSRLRYVLLFGDVNYIESEIVHENLTDHYYSTQKNPTGNDYELPWLAIGRIPVSNLNEAEQVVDKIIGYEKTPPCNQDYYDRMVFVAYFQDNYPEDGIEDLAYIQTMEEIREKMLQIGFNIDRIYVKKKNTQPQYYVGGQTCVPADVISEIKDSDITSTYDLVDATNEGQLIIAQRGHGSAEGWLDPEFLIKHLNCVSGKVPTIFYSLSCYTGMFDRISGPKCFAEKMLSIDAGAPSLIACTRGANPWLNNYLMKALFHAMWGNILPTFPGANSYPVRKNRLGDILNYGKTYLPLKVGTYSGVATKDVQDHLEIICVVGDPTLEIWKEEPKSIRISATLWNSQIYIRLSHCPADAVITIWDGGDKPIERIKPLSTTLTISLRGISHHVLPFRKRIKVCFWAPGFRFVQVVPKSSPYSPWQV
ncbi:MAG: C25 family cysteine peptidase [Desulfobacterales bacterium]